MKLNIEEEFEEEMEVEPWMTDLNMFNEKAGMYALENEDEFWDIIDLYRKQSPHIWKKVNNEWKLRHTVWGSGVDD